MCAYHDAMTLRARQPETLAALDAVITRARQVVDPVLLTGAEDRIAWLVADGSPPPAAADTRQAAAFAVIEQELIDVARLDDRTVQTAAHEVGAAQVADLVMASYALEARTRLVLAAERLLGGYE